MLECPMLTRLGLWESIKDAGTAIEQRSAWLT